MVGAERDVGAGGAGGHWRCSVRLREAHSTYARPRTETLRHDRKCEQLLKLYSHQVDLFVSSWIKTSSLTYNP